MKITYAEYLEWNRTMFARNNHHMCHRLGEAFCMDFNIDDEDLSNMHDYVRAAEIIHDKYVEVK